MYKEDYNFTTPFDQTIIWRYMDFLKLTDLLLSEELFFCRSDNFEDSYEGFLNLKDICKTQKETYNNARKFYFINCWHQNDFQSDAMWKIYLKSNNGVAIKSSVSNLKKALKNTPEDIHIAKVYYRDFDNLSFLDLMLEDQNRFQDAPGGTVNQFTYKRLPFEHEKELRLIYIDLPIPYRYDENSDRKLLPYKKVKINILDLIDEIIISPYADSWFNSLVENLLHKLNLDIKVIKSNLYER